jgi:transposase
LLPAAVRTYAPCGQTPELRYRFWDHLSVISAITPQGQLYTMTQEEAFKGPAIVRFLKHLLQHIPGKLLVVWDRLPAHRSQVVKDFLREGATRRIHLAQLPSYAPDLNPDEGVWSYLKCVELKNVCCHNLHELRTELRKAIARLRHKTEIVRSFIHQVYPDVCFSHLCPAQ